MGIYIKGTKMPKCCKKCFGCKADLFSDNGISCVVYLCQFTRTATGEEGILDICHLIEVPTPHGRLIDADELLNRKDLGIYDLSELKEILSYAPTIIEAEDGT